LPSNNLNFEIQRIGAFMDKALTSPAGVGTSGIKRLSLWYRRRRDTIVAYTFLTPMIIYFLIFTLVPLGFLIGMSLMEWNIITPPHYVGLRNILKVVSSYNNWFYLKVFLRTVGYAIAILSLNIVGGFLVALVMNQSIKGKGIFRTMWYLPSVFSGAVIALLMNQYFAGGPTGVVNMLIGRLGIDPIDWRTSTFWMPIITVLFSVWQGIGFTVIFFLAGLQSVDENLYDAAKIDGANERQLLWFITIPQMTPMLLFISVTGMIGSMQMWELPKMFSAGGPNYMTYTLIYSIQNDSFAALDMGMGTAQSLVLFVILLIFIGSQLNNYRKQFGV
jgi:multiple sugar transport system permease protein